MKRISLSLAVLLACVVLGEGAFAGPKILPTRSSLLSAGAVTALPAVPAAAGAHLLYYGGPVISNVKVNSVFWGNNVSNTVVSKIAGFYSTMVNSPYIDWLSEYNTNITAQNGKAGTNQSIGRGTFGGDFTITPSTTATDINDSDIQSEIAKQIDAGKLPQPDNNSIYMMQFPAGTTIGISDGANVAHSCVEFCAYHFSFHYKNGQNVFYAVMPDFETGGCAPGPMGGCGSNDAFGNYTNAASHEIVEAITDPAVGDVPGANADYPMGWFDPQPGMAEIGDICVQTQDTINATDGSSYIVQKQWSNTQNACVASAPKR